MNKFQKTLSADNKTIKAARAKIVSEDIKDAQEEVVRKIKQEKRDLERRLIQLSDLSPDSEFSLKVVKDNFDASKWAEETQEIKVALANKTVELTLAEETFNEWFTDVDVKASK